jgi:hypothetical protein
MVVFFFFFVLDLDSNDSSSSRVHARRGPPDHLDVIDCNFLLITYQADHLVDHLDVVGACWRKAANSNQIAKEIVKRPSQTKGLCFFFLPTLVFRRTTPTHARPPAVSVLTQTDIGPTHDPVRSAKYVRFFNDARHGS